MGTRASFDIVDNGRRGEPLPGCDCMRCFGYCLVDRDAARRESAALAEQRARARHGAVPPIVDEEE